MCKILTSLAQYILFNYIRVHCENRFYDMDPLSPPIFCPTHSNSFVGSGYRFAGNFYAFIKSSEIKKQRILQLAVILSKLWPLFHL